MVTKNISAIGPSGNVKPIPVYHIIPPPSSAIFKVTIDNGTTEIDITDRISSAKFNGGTTKTIGSFELEILDPSKTIFNQISHFNDVYIYGDYGETASTKRLRYKIEVIEFKDYKTILTGLGIMMKLASKKIIYRTVDSNDTLVTKTKSAIIQEIITQNFSDITDFSEIETNTDEVQKTYLEIPFLDVIIDLCGDTHEFYLDEDLVPHYFTRGSVKNEAEGISEDVNYLGANNNANSVEEVFSRVRVYGATTDEVQVIATSEEDTTITNGIKKDKTIVNKSIVNSVQAQQLADEEFERIRSAFRNYSLSSFFLPSLNPGEKLFIAAPNDGISPGYYFVQEFTHEFDLSIPNGFKTNVIVNKKMYKFSTVLKDTETFKAESSDTNNPYDMDFSQIITFDEDSGTHDGTEISEGYLKLSSGETSGIWISPIFTLNDNLAGIQIKWAGDYLVSQYQVKSSQIWFSLNGGATWSNYTKSLTSVPTGRDLRIKIVLQQATAQVKIIGVNYKY